MSNNTEGVLKILDFIKNYDSELKKNYQDVDDNTINILAGFMTNMIESQGFNPNDFSSDILKMGNIKKYDSIFKTIKEGQNKDSEDKNKLEKLENDLNKNDSDDDSDDDSNDDSDDDSDSSSYKSNLQLNLEDNKIIITDSEEENESDNSGYKPVNMKEWGGEDILKEGLMAMEMGHKLNFPLNGDLENKIFQMNPHEVNFPLDGNLKSKMFTVNPNHTMSTMNLPLKQTESKIKENINFSPAIHSLVNNMVDKLALDKVKEVLPEQLVFLGLKKTTLKEDFRLGSEKDFIEFNLPVSKFFSIKMITKVGSISIIDYIKELEMNFSDINKNNSSTLKIHGNQLTLNNSRDILIGKEKYFINEFNKVLLNVSTKTLFSKLNIKIWFNKEKIPLKEKNITVLLSTKLSQISHLLSMSRSKNFVLMDNHKINLIGNKGELIFPTTTIISGLQLENPEKIKLIEFIVNGRSIFYFDKISLFTEFVNQNMLYSKEFDWKNKYNLTFNFGFDLEEQEYLHPIAHNVNGILMAPEYYSKIKITYDDDFDKEKINFGIFTPYSIEILRRSTHLGKHIVIGGF